VIALGADEVIDYRTEHFEDRVKDVDLMLDFVGGETIERSWSVLVAGGAIVTSIALTLARGLPRVFVGYSPGRNRPPRNWARPRSL
jgi:NADPH:quinone reductase-like Zn-dependent oxidoreductase